MSALLDLQDSPLYENSYITTQESLLLLMSPFLKHNLSRTAMHDILKIIHLHLPPGTSFLASKYLFLDKFSACEGYVTCHFYCILCKSYLGEHVSGNFSCYMCHTEMKYEECLQRGSFFLTLSIQQQLQDLLGNPDVQKWVFKD